MRRNLIMLLILIFAAILYYFTMKTSPEEAPPSSIQLTLAMAKAQANLKGAQFEARLQVPAGEIDEDEIQAMLEQLALDLISTRDTKPRNVKTAEQERKGRLIQETESYDFGHATVADYVLRDESRGLELELSFNRSNPAEQGFFFAKATLKDPSILPEVEKHWQQVFDALGYQPRYSTLLTGTLRGTQTYNEQEAIMADVFQSLAVQEPWQMRDEGWVSWGGYSPRIVASLVDARGEPINVQAALRYHHLEECTYLYLGSPLIYREF